MPSSEGIRFSGVGESNGSASVNDQRERLWRFQGLGLYAYRGEHQAWARDASDVMREDGDNPYCRWFFGALRVAGRFLQEIRRLTLCSSLNVRTFRRCLKSAHFSLSISH
ncbi:hypothetical protein ACOXVJ_24825 [Pseudomonas knackmussii]|uniref:hypothetical protein n=1 Tax=Pseudomonas knackmussii TaxID=65741 RepID=UPI003BBB194F